MTGCDTICSQMIDALFGSKTRVKLLHLFLNNPGKSFYVREITRLIDEQINSVRRELANMLSVGIIVSDSMDNKLYYAVNQQYRYYRPLGMIFADKQATSEPATKKVNKASSWLDAVAAVPGLRVAVVAGALVRGSASQVDLLLVGDVSEKKINTLMKQAEVAEKKAIHYAVLSYDDFYYRLSVRDKFIGDIISSRHVVLVDTDEILK